MLTKDVLINLANKNYIDIVFKNNSFELIAPHEHIFSDGKKNKEYIYENFLFDTIENAKYFAIVYAYFEIKNHSLINLKDKKFETVKSNSSINC